MQFLEEQEFTAAFQAKLRETRTAMAWSQAQMAAALDLRVDTYKKYENRSSSVFPLYLVPKLMFITNTNFSYWFGMPDRPKVVQLVRDSAKR